ncbi:virulence-associated protein E [Stutzerimonas frequens]|uniref:virulence-associated protein E n=1 Tax=Stutzerimonas frequens TaxID=2968969 RepID=UPI0037490815
MAQPQLSGDPLDLLLDRHPDARKYGKRYIARCRAHEDASPSLSLSRGQDGRALIHCFAGCTPRDVLTAVGLELRDLFPNGQMHQPRRGPSRAAIEHERRIVAIGLALLAEGSMLPTADLQRLETACHRLTELERRK